jgi:hypothetical protein
MSNTNVRINFGMIEALSRKKSFGEKFRTAVDDASIVDGNSFVMPFKDWEDIQVDFGLKKSRGVGDTIAKLTKKVGIKPCGGCKKRRAKFNDALPFGDGDVHKPQT